MMTILFVFDVPIYSTNGGVERITHTLGTNFMKEGHRVLFLARKHRECNLTQSIPQYYFPNENIRDDRNVKFYHNFIIDNKIDVVINQNGAEEASYLYCNVPNNVKLITVNHTYPLLSYYTAKESLRNLLYDYSIKNILKYTIKGVLYPYKCLSEKRRLRHKLSKLYSYVLDKSNKFVLLSPHYFQDIKYITNGACDYSKLRAIPNANSYSDSDIEHKDKLKQILYVGRLSIREKRPDRLLEIWSKLYKKFGDWEFVVVGGGGADSDAKLYMERMVKRKKIERIKFVGSANPLIYYQTASLSCMVSNYEGFGLVITEAMQNGVVPFVFNSYGAASDIIVSGIDGILVTPFDCDEFALKLSELMENETLRKTMSINAVNSVKKFNFENVYTAWKRLLA